MFTIRTMSKEQLIKHLQIAEAQRKRALTKFEQDYGQNHPVTNAVRAELTEITVTITEIRNDQTDLEGKAPKK